MRWLRRGLIALLALIVGSLAIGIWQINQIATRVVEQQGTRALGVDTTIDFISIGFLPPSLRIGGCEIENPEGFAERNFLSVGHGTLETHPGTLFQETIVAPFLLLEGIELSVERQVRGTNYGVILDNLKKTDSGKDAAPTAAEGGAGKRFRIDRIIVRDARATVAIGGAGRSQSAKLRVPEIRLDGVGRDGGVGAGEVLNAIVVGLLESLAKQGGLPKDLAGDMLAQLKGLQPVGFEVSGDIVRSGDDLLDSGLDKAGDAAHQTRRGLGKLIPGRD